MLIADTAGRLLHIEPPAFNATAVWEKQPSSKKAMVRDMLKWWKGIAPAFPTRPREHSGKGTLAEPPV